MHTYLIFNTSRWCCSRTLIVYLLHVVVLPLLMSSGISILVASLFHPITSKVSSDLGCRVPRLSVIINALPFRVYSLGDPACFQVSASLRLLTRNELHLASDLVYFAYYSSRGLNLSVIFHRHSRIMSAKWIGRRKIGL